VLDFLTARYGEFVLLKPRFAWRTAFLWGTPVLLLVLGALGLAGLARRRAAAGSGEAAKLSGAEERRVADILRQGG
jgi:cytochrome c-type biogenesis protein CcmH